ncbi:MAG: 30S ribosomal protein S6 [Pseudomonadota bacterium]
MKRYETIFITHPDLADEEQQNVFVKVKDLIPKQGGTILKFDEWGLKNLAYEIKKQTRGYYTYIDYTGGAGLVKELERVMGIDDRIMKYMTVLTNEAFDPASIVQEAKPTSAEEDASDDSPKEDDSSKEVEQEQTLTETHSEEGA